MTDLVLEPIAASDPRFRNALMSASLPTDDLDEDGRSFFVLHDGAGDPLGYSGLENCGTDLLLRSMVVVPERRGQGLGRVLAGLTIAKADCGADIYLATTTAAPFFRTVGFETVNRADLPSAILSTRQLSGLCPASATIMKLTRPPT
ncbi:GNAT family N-acetyltransferase [Agrobacterium vitis]|uniref:arsenic resistance N-acetyltransferase ArsN2 n=1 Tax=Agrobacterium vitis TaxID=373 RepID=UPI001F2A2002|nr:arsenic resistance N-acetyltransferase ArsN2 [Agrobacterium vitis]MCE6077460.1 GNAT family N-acetyltransferase [Agrobacterium vitis]